MRVRDATEAAQVAARVPTRRVEASGNEKPQTSSRAGQATPQGDVVEISAARGAVLERHGVTGDEQTVAVTANGGREGEQTPRQGGEPAETRELRRDYDVDDGGLVVKVIDRKANEVIKEIPPEEQRRIREAVSRAAEQSMKQDAPPEAAGGIDVTS